MGKTNAGRPAVAHRNPAPEWDIQMLSFCIRELAYVSFALSPHIEAKLQTCP